VNHFGGYYSSYKVQDLHVPIEGNAMASVTYDEMKQWTVDDVLAWLNKVGSKLKLCFLNTFCQLGVLAAGCV